MLMTIHSIVLLFAAIDQVAAAGLRGAVVPSAQPKVSQRQPPAVDAPAVAAIERGLEQQFEEAEAGEISLIQLEASMQTKVGRPKTQGQLDATQDVADTFRHSVEGALNSFGASVADVSGGVQDKYEAADTKEAEVSLAVLEEIGTLKAENLDLQEQLSLLIDDKVELEKGLKELEKNVSMAKEFGQTAKTGLYGAPQPQLEMGSFEGLDNDEEAFKAKHGPHPTHKDELLATNVHESAWDPTAVLRAIEGSLPPSQDEGAVRHAALHHTHEDLLVERDALRQQREELQQRLAAMKRETQPFADRVLQATYNGVSLNMRVVAQSSGAAHSLPGKDCDDESGTGCRSRSWLR